MQPNLVSIREMSGFSSSGVRPQHTFGLILNELIKFYLIAVILMRDCWIVRSLPNFNLCRNLLILISDKNQGDN